MSADDLGPRLVDMPDQHPEAARLVRLAAPPKALGPEALERIAGSIAERQDRRARGVRVPWWAFASLGLAGVAAAATVAERFLGPLRAPPGPAPVVEVARPRPVRGPVVTPTDPVPALEPAPSPAPVEAIPPPAARPKAAPRPTRPAPAEAPPPAASASALAEESELLQQALRKLRHERDPAGALVVLDRYAARFPGGQLAPEADRTRVEALLLQSRPRPALQVLDSLSFGASARDLDLALVRGELRAEAGRCAEAEADFDAVLGRVASGARAERALWGRASCRSRRGDETGARADLEAYLARFPSGKQAPEARRALGR